MLIASIIRKFINRVDFIAEGIDCERILNFCMKSNIEIINPSKKDFCLSGTVYAKDYRILKKFAVKCGIKVRISNKKGPYFLIKRHKDKFAAVFGIAFILLSIFVLNSFILQIEVYGNNSVAADEIIETAQNNGLRFGSLKKSQDIRKLEWQIMNSNSKLSWVTVNIQGCTAKILVNESVPLPEMKYDDDKPVNIVASRYGIIRKIDVFDGQKVAKVGDAVMKGDLLVSAVYEDRYNKLTLKHSRADIRAETDYKIEAVFPITQTVEKTEKIAEQIEGISIFGLKIDFKRKNGNNTYVIDEYEDNLYFLWIKLPIKIQKNRIKYVKQNTVTYDIKQAKYGAFELLGKKEQEELSDSVIVSKKVSEKLKDEKYIVSADYICIMNIAEEQDILSNEPWENTDDMS